MKQDKLTSILPALITNRFSYQASRLALRFLRKKMSPYQFAAAEGLISELECAYTGRKPVIMTTAFVPTEVVYGLGAIPYLPEIWSGFAAALRTSEMGIDESESLGYSQDLCSFHRCHLGLDKMNLLPRPSAIIVSSQLCDGGRRSLYAHALSARCPFYVLDVPYEATDYGLKYLSQQVKDICEQLSRKIPGLNTDGMTRALENSNRAREIYLEVCHLRSHQPAPWSGSEALNYVFAFLSGWGSDWLINFYENLKITLKRRIEEREYPVPHERFRLLWLNMRPFYSTPLFERLAEWGASVAFEEYSYLYWPRMDTQRWAESIALKILSNFGWGYIERRLDAVGKMVDTYSIDGVVQFDQWGCRQSNGGGRMLTDYLRQKGVPFLELDGDGVDPRNGGLAQSLTRLQAFIELIEARHKRPLKTN